MKFGREICFLLSVLATGLILNLVSYDATKVALLRMDNTLRGERGFFDEISSHCRLLYSRNDGKVEKFFLERLSPSGTATGTEGCQLSVVSESTQRFYLATQWNFGIQVRSEESAFSLERNYPVQFPRPLALLPLAVFVLALVFELKFWGLWPTLFSYLFLLSGGNLIRTFSETTSSTWLAITTEPTLPGLLLILLWISLYRHKRSQHPITRGATTSLEGVANRFITLLIGLWNPGVYTMAGRLLFPFKGTVARLIPFLDAQFFVLCLSLYLLSVDIKNIRDLFDKSLFLPRYFSFAALLFFAVTYWSSRSRRQVLVWNLPRFWIAIGAVAITELAALRLPFLKQQPTLLRVGLALVVSELAWPFSIDFKKAAKSFLPGALLCLVATFVATHSQETGVKDLIMVLLEPKMHPSVIVLFTFLAGLGLGFITGNFSASFFALFTALIKAQDEPLLRAAMLDGILAGSLLSPFSLHNLLPLTQFELKLPELITFRFKQLATPMVIGATIYAVSAINSVAILQPVTFVFMCLLAVTFQLRKSEWHLGKFSLTLHSGPS